MSLVAGRWDNFRRRHCAPGEIVIPPKKVGDSSGCRVVVPQPNVLVASTFASDTGVDADCFLAFAVRRSDVFETRERTIFLGSFDVDLNKLTKVDNKLSTDGPPASAVSTSFDRERDGVFITEKNYPVMVNK
jgi:hypothetical protein